MIQNEYQMWNVCFCPPPPSGELYGPNEMLKGFLIECGPENTVGESETSVGQFVALDSSIQKHVCGQVGLKCL